MKDQLRRAAASIPLNIAEGAGKFHRAEKKRFYLIARGSCLECVAALELCCGASVIDRVQRAEMRRKLERVSMMLTRLIQSCDRERKEATR